MQKSGITMKDAISAMQSAIDRYYSAEIAARHIKSPEHDIKLANRKRHIVRLAELIIEINQKEMLTT